MLVFVFVAHVVPRSSVSWFCPSSAFPWSAHLHWRRSPLLLPKAVNRIRWDWRWLTLRQLRSRAFNNMCMIVYEACLCDLHIWYGNMTLWYWMYEWIWSACDCMYDTFYIRDLVRQPQIVILKFEDMPINVKYAMYHTWLCIMIQTVLYSMMCIYTMQSSHIVWHTMCVVYIMCISFFYWQYIVTSAIVYLRVYAI